MLKFFYNAAPNPMKIALLLEELGLAYEAIPVDTRKGEQFTQEFLAVNPNAKVPAVIDGPVTLFDSNAILLFLADRAKQFVATDLQSAERAQTLSWLMFIASGIGPFSGQSVHFRNVAPEPKDYALNRYDYEANRHWGVIEAHLAKHEFMVGGQYSIVDMATVPWVDGLADGYQAQDVLPLSQFPRVEDWVKRVTSRPAYRWGRTVGSAKRA